MEYVTKHTVQLEPGVPLAPGTPVNIKDEKLAKTLVDAGAIAERTLTVSEAKKEAAAGDEAGDESGDAETGKGKGKSKGGN